MNTDKKLEYILVTSIKVEVKIPKHYDNKKIDKNLIKNGLEEIIKNRLPQEVVIPIGPDEEDKYSSEIGQVNTISSKFTVKESKYLK